MMSWSRMKMGDTTSEYSKRASPFNFWHSKYLKMNSRANMNRLQRALTNADL